MNFAQYLLLVLLSLPGAYHDKETWDERVERMTVVADAVDEVASRATCSERYNDPSCEKVWPRSKKELALLLVTKAWWESRFALNVHEGNCRDFECDAYKTRSGRIIHRARTLWQIQMTGLVKRTEWDSMVGTDFESTRMAAWVATRIMSNAMNRCRTIYGTISSYALNRCEWSGAGVRYSFWKKLMTKSEDQLRESMQNRELLHRQRDEEREKAVEQKGHGARSQEFVASSLRSP
jgi:hypothetical protein